MTDYLDIRLELERQAKEGGSIPYTHREVADAFASLMRENAALREFADGMADAAGLYALEACIAAYRKQFPKPPPSQRTDSNG